MTIDTSKIQFNDDGLIPAIVQDEQSGDVLMLAYMNEKALQKTIETKETWFYSRSRQELWHKGATSGNKQQVKQITIDCDADTLLVQVAPLGPACHTGEETCFFNSLVENEADRKSTRLNSSHVSISYAVFCLKKKKVLQARTTRSLGVDS